MIGIFHTAGLGRRRFDRIFVHCVSKPAHDFFSEEVNLDPFVIEENIVPHRDPLLADRKVHSNPFAAIRDIKDRFDRHPRHPVAKSDGRCWQVQKASQSF
jgi:hypothetical protein